MVSIVTPSAGQVVNIDSSGKAETLGLVANIVELSSVAIRIVQQIRRTRATIRNFPKVLSDNTQLLDELVETLQLVINTEVLRTVRVAEQVESVARKAEDVRVHLTSTCESYKRGTVRRYILVLLSGPSDEKELSSRLHRLSTAKDDLQLRIQIVGVELTGNLHTEFQGAVSAILDSKNEEKKISGEGRPLVPRPSTDGEHEGIKGHTEDTMSTPSATPQDAKYKSPGHRYYDTTTTGNVLLQQGGRASKGAKELIEAKGPKNNYEKNNFGGNSKVLQGDQYTEGDKDFFSTT